MRDFIYIYCFHVSLCVCLTVHVSVCLSVRPSVSLCLSVYLPVSLSVCPSLFLKVCLPLCLSGHFVGLSVRLSVCKSACLPFRPSVHVSIRQSLDRSVCPRVSLSALPSVSLFAPSLSLFLLMGLRVCCDSSLFTLTVHSTLKGGWSGYLKFPQVSTTWDCCVALLNMATGDWAA